MAAARGLPQKALRIYGAEIERLQRQQNELRGDIERLLEKYGGQQVLPSGGVDPELSKLARDLQTALAVATKKKEQAADRLYAFEVDAQREEDELRAELHEAQRSISVVRDRHEAASQRAHSDMLRAEIRSAEMERDAALRTTAELELELAPRATDAIEEDVADAAAVDALGADAVENMLRAEAAALRTALKFYREQRQTAAHARATVKAEEALTRREEAQREEAVALQAAEERVRVGQAMVKDALESTRRQPVDESDESCEELKAHLAGLESNIEELQKSLVPLQEQHGHLQWLRRVAEARIVELEERFASQRMTTPQIVKHVLEEKQMEGVAALLEVLSRVCGSPRIAFLVLDSNHNGRLSMSELDMSLRQRLFLDYEAITGMNLRMIFKAFDVNRRGVVCEQDFCTAWAMHQQVVVETGASPKSQESPAQVAATPRFG